MPSLFLLANTVNLNQSTPKHFYLKYQSALLRTLLRLSDTTFVEKAVYKARCLTPYNLSYTCRCSLVHCRPGLILSTRKMSKVVFGKEKTNNVFTIKASVVTTSRLLFCCLSPIRINSKNCVSERLTSVSFKSLQLFYAFYVLRHFLSAI